MALLASHNQHARKISAARHRQARLARQELGLGLSALSTEKLIHLIERGIPFKALNALSDKTGIPIPELASVLRIPERTLARRRVAGRLAPDESERLMRVASIFEKAVQFFEGEAGAAVTWLKGPKKAH